MPTQERRTKDEQRRADEKRVAAMHAKGERALHAFEQAVQALTASCTAHMAALPDEVQRAVREVRAATAHKAQVARETEEMYAAIGREGNDTYTGGGR